MAETKDWDFSELRMFIKIRYGSLEKFAKKAGMGLTTLRSRLSGKVLFSIEEIHDLSALLEMTTEETKRYFFPMLGPNKKK